MALISCCRCDERLIHGQVIYKWMEALKLEQVIVVDDKAANDVIEKGFIKMAAPKNLKLQIISVNEIDRYFYNNNYDERTLVLIRDLDTANKIMGSDVKIKKLILGRIPAGIGRKKIADNVYLNKDNMELLNKFIKLGVNVVIQMVPDECEICLGDNIAELERRYFS